MKISPEKTLKLLTLVVILEMFTITGGTFLTKLLLLEIKKGNTKLKELSYSTKPPDSPSRSFIVPKECKKPFMVSMPQNTSSPCKSLSRSTRN